MIVENKLAFDSEIEIELNRLLNNTIWQKVGKVNDRSKQLMSLHDKYISNVRNKLSANEIAVILYKYELNILKRTCN